MVQPKTSLRTVAKNSIFLYFRMGFIMLFSLASVRFLLRELHVEDYGIYNAIGGVVASLSVISGVLSSVAQRYFSYFLGQNDLDGLNRTFGSTMIVYTIIAGVILLLGETIGYWFVMNKLVYPEAMKNSVFWIYQFSLFTFIIVLFYSPLIALIISHEETKIFAIISIADGVMKFGCVFMLSWFYSYRVVIYPLFLLIISLIILTCYTIVTRRRYSYISFKFIYERKTFNSIMSFSFWSMFGSFANAFYHQGINILFNIFVGPLANAAFAIANHVNAAITSFSSSFFLAVRPGIIKSYAQNEMILVQKLFLFSNKILFILLFIIVLPIVIDPVDILNLWLGDITPYTAVFVRMMSITCMILCLGLPITTIIQASGKVKYYHILVDGFISLSCILIYFILKKGLGPTSALWGVIAITFIAHLIRIAFLRINLNFPIRDYFAKFVMPMTIIVVIAATIVNYCAQYLVMSAFLRLICISTISTLIIGGMSLALLINSKERNMILNIVYKKYEKNI